MPGPKMIESGLQHGQRLFRESSDYKNVLRPGDKMYHGRIGMASPAEQKKLRGTWERMHGLAAGEQRRHDADAASDARYGRELLVTGGTLTAGSAGLGYLGRKVYQRDNRKLRRELSLPAKGKVRKWDEREPFMVTSDRRDSGPHKVSILSAAPKVHHNLGRTARMGRYLLSDKATVPVAAAMTAGSFAALPFLMGPAKENEELHRLKEQRKLRRKYGISKGAKSTVARAAAGYTAGAAVGDRLARPLGRRLATRALAQGKTAEQADAREMAVRYAGANLGGPPGAIAAVRFRKSYLPEAPLENIPRYAMHATRGRVRIIAYHPKHMTGSEVDRFTVHDFKRDAKVTVPRESLTFLKDVKKADNKTTGAAMAGSGAVVGGAGLLASGVPGAKEPNSLRVWLLRGHSKTGRLSPKEVLRPSNVRNNARQIAPQPRAGILGFRANMHDAFIEDTKNKRPRNSYERGMLRGQLNSEHKIVRQMRLGRKAGHGLTLGGAALAAAGLHRMHQSPGRKVNKSDDRRRTASAAALGAGGTMAGVTHVVPKGLDRAARHYERSASNHVLEAQRLAPHFGGLKVTPAKIGVFGEIRRPARTTMYPEKSGAQLQAEGAVKRIKGGAKVREQVAEHRGAATQERHFAEAFSGTGKVMRRFRGPGLAIAGAGATGLWASQGRQRAAHNRNGVGKSVTYGYQQTKRSVPRTAELAGGMGLLAYGGPRLKALGPASSKGVKFAEKHGAGEEARAALELARAFGRQANEVTGRGEAKLRRITAVDNAVRLVPKSIRGEVAAAAGVLMAVNAHPTTKSNFVPVGRA